MHNVGDQEVSSQISSEDMLQHKRKRKALSSSSSVCPVCGLSIRTTELDSHYEMEVCKLSTINTRKSAHARMRKLNSKSQEKRKSRSFEEDGKDFKGDALWDKSALSERNKKLTEIQRRRRTRQAQVLLVDELQHQEPAAQTDLHIAGPSKRSSCPICGVELSGDERTMVSHVEMCIAKKEGVSVESGTEDDNESFEEYTWAGQTRVRVTSMLESGLSSLEGKTMRLSTTDENEELNIDDEDSSIFGAPQYFEKDIIPCPADEPTENRAREKLRAAMVGDQLGDGVTPNRASKWADDELVNGAEEVNGCSSNSDSHNERSVDPSHVIKIIRNGVSKLESICSEQPRCLICMESYQDPLVSVVCWHVHCEECWLRTLGAKKLCPQCNVITSPGDLRKIYL